MLLPRLPPHLWEKTARYTLVLPRENRSKTPKSPAFRVLASAELPSYEVFNTETPSPHNPLGAKGIGESATLGSTPAVHNAVVDALAHLGVRHLDMPCTSERVWRAMQEAHA